MNTRWSELIRLGVASGVPLIGIWSTLRERKAEVSYLEVQLEYTKLLRERRESLK